MIQAKTRPQPIRDSKPERVRHSKAGEIVWELAERDHPRQGEWTERDFFAIDNRRVEFSNGFLEFLPVPIESHELIMSCLFEALRAYVRKSQIGGIVLPSGMKVRMRNGKLRDPDVKFMRRENASRRGERWWDGADLAIEIVSGGSADRKRDIETKVEEYAQTRIPEYWIVDPKAKKITVFKLNGHGKAYTVYGEFKVGEKATSVLLEGFAVDVADALAGKQ